MPLPIQGEVLPNAPDQSSTRKAIIADCDNSLPRLRHLSLDYWPLNDAGAVALAENPSLTNLAWLDLSNTDIGVKV